MSEYIRPVDIRVSSGYGMRQGGFHYGVDFSDGISGHPIHAVRAGVVTYQAYESGGFGNTVTVTHPDGIKSGYGHMNQPAQVGFGQAVEQGQILGFVGTTGASTGPHLHLWMGAGPNPPGVINPEPLILGSPMPGDTPEAAPVHDRKVNPKMWCAWIIDINWVDVYYNGVMVDGFKNDDQPVFGVGNKLKRYLDGGSAWTSYQNEAQYAPVRDRLVAAAA